MLYTYYFFLFHKFLNDLINIEMIQNSMYHFIEINEFIFFWGEREIEKEKIMNSYIEI